MKIGGDQRWKHGNEGIERGCKHAENYENKKSGDRRNDPFHHEKNHRKKWHSDVSDCYSASFFSLHKDPQLDNDKAPNLFHIPP